MYVFCIPFTSKYTNVVPMVGSLLTRSLYQLRQSLEHKKVNKTCNLYNLKYVVYEIMIVYISELVTEK